MANAPEVPAKDPGVLDRGSAEIVRMNRHQKMEKYFAEQPRETIRIRNDLGAQTVRINGYPFLMQAGVKLKVPVDVAEILRDGDII